MPMIIVDTIYNIYDLDSTTTNHGESQYHHVRKYILCLVVGIAIPAPLAELRIMHTARTKFNRNVNCKEHRCNNTDLVFQCCK